MPLAKVRSATGPLQTIAQTVAIPQDHKPLRLPTFPNLERTATLSFMRTRTLGVTGTQTAMLCRSPTYPLWGTINPQVGVTGTVKAYWQYLSGDIATAGSTKILENPTDVDAPTLTPGMSTKWLEYYIIGRRDNRYGIYIPPGADIWLDVTFSTPGIASYSIITLTFVPMSQDDDQDVFQASVGIANGGNAVSFGQSGGFVFLESIKYETIGSATSFVGIQLGFKTNTSAATMLPLFTPTEFGTAPLVYRSTRVTAVGCLFSNVSQVLNKEGTVEAARLNRATGGLISNTGSKVSTTHPKDRYFGPLENGLYTFTLPDKESEQFVDCGWDADGVAGGVVPLTKPVFDLDTIGYKNTIIFADLDPTASTTLAVSLSVHLEFRSSSMLFPVGYTAVQLEEYHRAQMALAQLGCFFENPTHWAALAAAVRTAASKLAPLVMPAVRAAAKAGGQVLLSTAAKQLGNGMGAQARLQKQAKPKANRQQRKKTGKKAR